ncbi:Metallocarboxypeptidase A-like protein [Metarhizium anisopliae]|nr:Metallocarboxypeptidase A-like protein [Metarhizium anisopliae]
MPTSTSYSYSWEVQARNNDKLLSVAEGAAEAIYSVHNTSFKYGPSCRISGKFYGRLLDFVADVIRVDYAFVFELRSGGRFRRFMLPRDEIIPSGEETFAGVKYILQNMK